MPLPGNKQITLLICLSTLLIIGVESYELYPDGAAGICPEGKAVSKLECLQAAQEVGTNMTLKETLNVGSWPFTPCGCFIYIDHWIDYKNPVNGNCLADPKSKLVCKKEAESTPAPVETDYEIYADGAAGICPEGKAVSKENCLQAAQDVGIGMALKDALNVGSWLFTPCGCFIYDDHWIDYKNPVNGNCIADPNSNLVCKKEAGPTPGPVQTDYEIYADGAAGICPENAAITQQECLQAAQEVGINMELRDTLNVGSWPFAPCGCFIYIDHWVDYKNPVNGNCFADSKSNLVCKKYETKFELYPSGDAGTCPEGKDITLQDCLQAAQEVGTNMMLEDSLIVASHEILPCGCFIYDDLWINYKHPAYDNCAADPKSNLVCKKEAIPTSTPVQMDFEIYAAGAAGICPEGTAVTEEDCLQAAQEVGTSMTLKDTLNVGSWPFTPCGCFIYIDHWIDYKDPANGNCIADSRSNLVCGRLPSPAPSTCEPPGTTCEYLDCSDQPCCEGSGSYWPSLKSYACGKQPSCLDNGSLCSLNTNLTTENCLDCCSGFYSVSESSGDENKCVSLEDYDGANCFPLNTGCHDETLCKSRCCAEDFSRSDPAIEGGDEYYLCL